MHDEEREYHAAAAFVYIGDRAFTRDDIWNGVEIAETAAIPLGQIGQALSHNWSATVVALALRNVATLRALIDEVNP
jgi:hypothetical protein